MKLRRIQNIQSRLDQGDIQSWEYEPIIRELLREVKVEYPLPENQIRAGVLHRVRTEGKIAAIKWYKAQTDLGLKDSKDAVEQMMDQNGIPRTTGVHGMDGRIRKTIGKKSPERMEQYQRQWSAPKGKKGSKKKSKMRTKLRLRHRVPPKPKKRRAST